MLHFQFEATKFEESWSRKALETFYEEGAVSGERREGGDGLLL